jgi:hypothetical protein
MQSVNQRLLALEPFCGTLLVNHSCVNFTNSSNAFSFS